MLELRIYWAIVTLTTVGYGDISPATPPGQLMASLIMIAGYAVLAVPTGIVTAELTRATKSAADDEEAAEEEAVAEEGQTCLRCEETDNKLVARYCMRCGEKLAGII